MYHPARHAVAIGIMLEFGANSLILLHPIKDCRESVMRSSVCRPECKSRLNFAGVLFFSPPLEASSRFSLTPPSPSPILEEEEEEEEGILHRNLSRGHDFNCVLESGVQRGTESPLLDEWT